MVVFMIRKFSGRVLKNPSRTLNLKTLLPMRGIGLFVIIMYLQPLIRELNWFMTRQVLATGALKLMSSLTGMVRMPVYCYVYLSQEMEPIISTGMKLA